MDCPYLGCDFSASEHGIKIHHATVHDESLTKEQSCCEVCGDSFEFYPHHHAGRFCSMDCRNETEWREYDADVELECENCGEFFSKKQWRTNSEPTRFCSHECYWSAREYPSGEDHPLYNSRIIPCDTCGDDIEKPESHITERNYCSRDCLPSGEDSWFWVGGYDEDYGPMWSEQREEALERDDYECQDCGMSREQHYETFGADLHVHHIDPFRTFDDTAAAHELDNLITYCTRCHASHEPTDDSMVGVPAT